MEGVRSGPCCPQQQPGLAKGSCCLSPTHLLQGMSTLWEEIGIEKLEFMVENSLGPTACGGRPMGQVPVPTTPLSGASHSALTAGS